MERHSLLSGWSFDFPIPPWPEWIVTIQLSRSRAHELILVSQHRLQTEMSLQREIQGLWRRFSDIQSHNRFFWLCHRVTQQSSCWFLRRRVSLVFSPDQISAGPEGTKTEFVHVCPVFSPQHVRFVFLLVLGTSSALCSCFVSKHQNLPRRRALFCVLNRLRHPQRLDHAWSRFVSTMKCFEAYVRRNRSCQKDCDLIWCHLWVFEFQTHCSIQW